MLRPAEIPAVTHNSRLKLVSTGLGAPVYRANLCFCSALSSERRSGAFLFLVFSPAFLILAYTILILFFSSKAEEKETLRTRREPATAPAWALSWGIEMAKTENRKPKNRAMTRGRVCVCSPCAGSSPYWSWSFMWCLGLESRSRRFWGCPLWALNARFLAISIIAYNL